MGWEESLAEKELNRLCDCVNRCGTGVFMDEVKIYEMQELWCRQPG